MANYPPPPPPPITTVTNGTSSETEQPRTPPLTNGVHPSPPIVALSYGKCNRNYAAATGGHVLDGCGEFSRPLRTPTDPQTIYNCDACGCHRSFHWRPTSGDNPPLSPPHSPSPISSTAPAHMAPALLTVPPPPPPPVKRNRTGRFRTKFTEEQKTKMGEFAERIGWKLSRKDDEMVVEFCMEIGVTKRVLKVWLHNHKNVKTLRSTELALS